MKATRVFAATLSIVAAGLILLLSSCGGGGGSIGGVITPATTASLSPSSLSFGNQNLNVQSEGQTVVLTNTGTAALKISGIAIAGADAGDFSQKNICGTSLAAGANCNIVVMFEPTAAGARTASLTVSDNASGSPQSAPLSGTGVVQMSILKSPIVALLDSTQSIPISTDATCASQLFGNLVVSGSATTGYAVAYTVPGALPSLWTDMLSCAATADPTKTATAQIALQYPVPTITSTSATGNTLGTLFAYGPVGGSFTVNGSGFYSDGSFNPLNDAQDICGASIVNSNQVTVSIALGYADFGIACAQGASQSVWDPGFLEFTASDPQNGHGGGTSNVGRLAFLGDQNLVTFNGADVFLADPVAGVVRKFKLADGSPDGSFTVTPGTILAISADNTTGDIVVFTDSSTEGFDPVTNAKLFEIDASGAGLHGGAAGDGWAVLSAYDGTQGFPNVLDAINLQQPTNGTIHVSVKGTPQNFPWNFQLTELSGNPTEVVWSAWAGVLSTITPSSLSVTGSVTLPNLTVGSSLSLSSVGFGAGWQLQVFNSGPAAGTAVLLSQYDQELVYVNLANMTEIRRVDLTQPFKNANPPLPVLQSFRIGKDEADGSIVVAFADPVNGKTVLYNVDMSGNMTPLKDTAPFLATGLQESSDGTQIYWGNRSSFAIVPKQ